MVVHSFGATTFVQQATTTLNELVTLTAAGSDTNYVSLKTACVSQTANGACNDATVATTGTLTSATFTFGTSAPAGDTFTVTLMRNAAAVGPNCTITGTASCTIAGGQALTAGDKIELRVVKSSGSTAFVSTATTAAAVNTALADPATTLTAPSVTTSQANDQIVRFYGTGDGALSGVETPVATGSSTATGFEDTSQAAIGATGSATATSSSSANWVAQTIALAPSGPGCQSDCWYGLEDGGSTYYAGAIAAAQTQLTTNGRTGVQKVIIFLSDGAANTVSSSPCQDGITAAENAETTINGSATWFFSIFYGNAADDTCSDSSHMAGVCALHIMADNYKTNPNIASTDPQQNVCADNSTDPAHRFYYQPSNGDLTTIFKAIGSSLSTTRLVSNDAT